MNYFVKKKIVNVQIKTRFEVKDDPFAVTGGSDQITGSLPPQVLRDSYGYNTYDFLCINDSKYSGRDRMVKRSGS